MKYPIYTCQLVRTANVNYAVHKITSTTQAVESVCALFREILADSPNEQFWIVTLDTKLKPIGLHHITSGTLDASLCHPREVFRHAILANANKVLLVHNHPSGDLTPSSEDRAITARLKTAGDVLGITVVDHIIVGISDSGEWCGLSLAEHS